jgi:hypothetical protein
MNASQTWFPGKDYPDREVWLKFRAPRISVKARLIHDSAKGPLVLSLNRAKRIAARVDRSHRSHAVKMTRDYLGGTTPKRQHLAHAGLVRQRHEYYAKRADAA